ncbi:hypothetical protein, partial [Klebsiella quasipneumoniae]|uniref:hypothetical protein n=1 Tax=Klebsiella quasipneumoniae TaxID=1463165 RepID=UPI001C453328
MLYNCYIFICDCIHIFFRKHGFRDQRQRRGKEKVDYGEGFAMTGFYVALNEDNGAGMAGFSPEAVLRTLSGLRIRSPGKRSTTGGGIPHTATPHSKKPRTFRDGVLFKRKNKKLSLSTELSALFDAWQFMAGVLPATLRAVAAQR